MLNMCTVQVDMCTFSGDAVDVVMMRSECNRWSEVSAGFEPVRIVGNPRGGLNFEHDSRDNDTWSLTVVGSVLKGSRDQGRSVA
jgi:hypothetical protein